MGLSGYSDGGERGVAPGADFSFASSDSKTLGAFSATFPTSTGDGSSPGAAWVSASGAPARERRRGSIACLFVAPARLPRFQFGFERYQCFARRKISFRPARRIRQRSCGSRPERTVSRAPVYQMLWLPGFRATTISGRGFNLFRPLRRHFRATPSCRLGKKFVERLGTDSEARKKAKAPQPLIRRLAAQRDARRGFDGGRRRFWMAGLL